LTGGQAASLYFASVMHSQGFCAFLLAIAGLDTDAAEDLVAVIMNRIGNVFNFTVNDGNRIPNKVREAAIEYAESVENSGT